MQIYQRGATEDAVNRETSLLCLGCCDETYLVCLFDRDAGDWEDNEKEAGGQQQESLRSPSLWAQLLVMSMQVVF